MCQSCGGTCGTTASRRRGRITFDVKVNGRTVFVRDGKMRTFDRMPIVGAKVRDTVPLGGKLEWTSERFLLCRDVPLARTGDQIYLSYEVPGLPAKGGQIIAQRDADQVFDNAAIESFRGKPFTDDHPFEDVTPANFKEHMIGTVMNPRRGTGDALNHLLGDILVYDAGAADDIWNRRKTEVSAGYSCDYEVIAPGRARQIGIRGNHVSLVDAGRCGPTCAIRH